MLVFASVVHGQAKRWNTTRTASVFFRSSNICEKNIKYLQDQQEPGNPNVVTDSTDRYGNGHLLRTAVA